MTRFVMYVVNLEEGTVEGTNNAEVAEQFIDNDEYLVIHKDSGVYWLGGRKENQILEIEVEEEDNPDEDDDEENK